MSVLIGSTGFVGGHLSKRHTFAHLIHRSNIKSIVGLNTELLVCAGLPAEKWRANSNPESDWNNMVALAQVLTKVQAQRAILISTIDVYQPAIDVDESISPNLDGIEAYGTHRAWFEAFFRSQFVDCLIVRLPALFATDLRKNLVYDLMNRRFEQLENVNPKSMFQFFDVTQIWDVIKEATAYGFELLNVTSEPVFAGQVGEIFDIELSGSSQPVRYNMKSIYADKLGGRDGYIFDQASILAEIQKLRENLNR